MELVFLHGFTGTPASLRWVEQALGARLARVFAPPLVGHHGGPSEPCRFEDEVERLARQIDGARLRGAHLLGYSLGGRLALGVALRAPELFRSLTLISASPGLDTEAEREQRRQADERWVTLLTERGLTAFLEAWSALPLWDPQRGLAAERLLHQQQERARHEALGLATSLRSVGLGRMPAYLSALPRLSLPVALLVGALDSKFIALGERMQRALPNASLGVVPNAGHSLLIEAPEAVAQVLGSADRDRP